MIMTFLLSSQNVCEYLARHSLCTQEDKNLSQIELKVAKNFNLLLSLHDGRQLLVKQERYNSQGKTAGEFAHEWQIQELLEHFPELSYLRAWLPEILHFNADDSIIVFNYLNDYRDLADFYAKENVFPTMIATTIGKILATIHSATLDRQDYQDFLTQNRNQVSRDQPPKLVRGIDRITPEVFGWVPEDGLKFFTLTNVTIVLGSDRRTEQCFCSLLSDAQ